MGQLQQGVRIQVQGLYDGALELDEAAHGLQGPPTVALAPSGDCDHGSDDVRGGRQHLRQLRLDDAVHVPVEAPHVGPKYRGASPNGRIAEGTRRHRLNGPQLGGWHVLEERLPRASHIALLRQHLYAPHRVGQLLPDDDPPAVQLRALPGGVPHQDPFAGRQGRGLVGTHGLDHASHVSTAVGAREQAEETALLGGGVQAGAVLCAELARDDGVVHAERVLGHSLGVHFRSPEATQDHGEWRADHDREKGAQEHQPALSRAHDVGVQGDADLHLRRPVRVAVLFVIGARRVVRQRSVGFRDLLEEGGRQGVLPILVRMVRQRLRPVRLLDLRHRSAAVDTEDVVRVEH
mmetsp:Transcript_113021/g.324813  ORF Transcript_113021/g.324813 Transcript_113021/m.324813 type:complete len:349 (-) Transcript_113021:499-1545(-)